MCLVAGFDVSDYVFPIVISLDSFNLYWSVLRPSFQRMLLDSEWIELVSRTLIGCAF